MGADAQARMSTHAIYAQDALIHRLALSVKHHNGMADTGCQCGIAKLYGRI